MSLSEQANSRPLEEGPWQAVLALRAASRGGMPGVPADGTPRVPLADRTLRVDADRTLRVDADRTLRVHADGSWDCTDPDAAALCELYLPLVAAAAGRNYVVAHLGQSLDGRIATSCGASKWVTGDEDVVHNHRMRALSDAVLVGAGTVRHDDPLLTVRRCLGDSPVRVVLDTERRLGPDYAVFAGDPGAPPTLLVCAHDRCRPGERLGAAEVVGVARAGSGLDLAAVLAALDERGLRFIFVEGGGITVSRFLEAGRLDRLQVTVAPLILGSGRPGLMLPEVATVDLGLRPRTRRFLLGPDVLFDCVLGEGP
ncbi:RibD family protein [Arenibaculum sp.]|uniref:RibD family protein n=1 Tax=Arenibaculum sp. TaxID=2865862 RepID=UPI002E13C495|nr:RibD family protein [Arenibaculum sp.]